MASPSLLAKIPAETLMRLGLRPRPSEDVPPGKAYLMTELEEIDDAPPLPDCWYALDY